MNEKKKKERQQKSAYDDSKFKVFKDLPDTPVFNQSMVVTPHKRWNTELNGSDSDEYLAEEENDFVPSFMRNTV